MSGKVILPHGVRFSPEKEEIFFHYLHPAINGDPPAYDFDEVDIYGGEKKEPWNLFELDEERLNKSFWVFTKLKKKSGQQRIDRVAGCGCWHNKGKRNEVTDSDGRLLGYEKYYIFTGKNDDNLKWMMHEYSVEGSSNLVFCEIKYELLPNNKRKSSTLDLANEGPSSSVKKICQNNHRIADQENPMPIAVIDQESQNPDPIMVMNTHSQENRDDGDGSLLLTFKDGDEPQVIEDLPDLPDGDYLPLLAANSVTYELNPTSADQILGDSFFDELDQLWDWRNSIQEHTSLVF